MNIQEKIKSIMKKHTWQRCSKTKETKGLSSFDI